MHPVTGPVSQEFGARPDFAWQLGYGHLGIDYAVPEGTPVRAIADCTILWADWCINMPVSFANANMFIPGTEGGGKTIVAQNDGYRAIYAHLSSFTVRSGDQVKRGDVIGHSGWTGNVVPRNANGAHLHFEVYTFPCSNTPPFSRYNPRGQIAHEDKQAPTILPAGNIAPARPLLIADPDGIPNLFADE